MSRVGLMRVRDLLLVASLALVALSVSAGFMAHTALGAVVEDFCERDAGNPYFAVFSELPPLHELPESGKLPFAPSVTITSANGYVVSHGEAIGFLVRSRPSLDSGDAGTKKWKVLAEVSLLRPDGVERRMVDRISATLKAGRSTSVAYESPDENGLYRVDIRLEKGDWRSASYAKYFRVAAPKFGPRISVSKERVSAGAVFQTRLENMGTTRIGAGYEQRFERFTGSGWEIDAGLHGRESAPRVLFILVPGSTFDCNEIAVPSDQTPGRYRIVKNVVKYDVSPSSGRRLSVMREFVVE